MSNTAHNFNFRKLVDITKDTETSINWCIDQGLIPNKQPKDCIHCGSVKKVCWQVRSRNANFPYCLKCSQCKKECSIIKNTWFEYTKLTVFQSLGLLYMWLVQVSIFTAVGEIEVSPHTVVEYFKFCREICYVIVTNFKEKIGGKNHIVELDEIETRLHTRKYERGRLLKDEIEHIWIFGGIDRETKNCFALRVDSRNSATLCSVIKEFVLPETKLYTDGWKAYNAIVEEGFEHGVVNHKLEFINSQNSTINTQNIERMWKSLKKCVKTDGRTSESDDLYIFEFLYRQSEKSKGRAEAHEMFIEFLKHVSEVYPGYGREGLTPRTYTQHNLRL